jgi:hypothetical protein
VAAPDAQDEEADLRVVRVPLAAAAAARRHGRSRSAAPVPVVRAAARVREFDPGTVAGGDGDGEALLRPADDGWDGGPATVNAGAWADTAPPLGAASNARINFSPRGSTSR